MLGDWARLGLVAGCSGAACAALLPPLRRLAIRLDATVPPRHDRAHKQATPYLGGVGIAVATGAAAALLGPGRASPVLGVLAAAGIVAAVGLADDVRDLRRTPRVAIEAAAAVAVFAAGARSGLLDGPADLVLTVAWLVLVTNGFNLLDNMDGCAGAVATVTATALAVAAGMEGQPAVAGTAAAVAGAFAAFLAFNWFPARIFMGDAGSLFLGFLLASLALVLHFPAPRPSRTAAVVLLAGPALFDTTLVVASRLRAGRPVTAGATDHTSHRLRRAGLPVSTVAILMGVAAALSGIAAVLVGRGVVAAFPVVAVALGLAGCGMVALLRIPGYDGAGARAPR